jgi:hypothetical protein
MSCAACEEKRRHTSAEMREFHPLAGHGFAGNVGWTHPELETAANERADRPSARSTEVMPNVATQ